MKKVSVLEYIKNNKQVLWALYLPIYLIMFLIVENIVTPDSAYWVVHIPLDDVIPFCEYFAIPYYMWYPFLGAVGIYLAIKDKDCFARYMMFIAIGFTATMIFSLIIPNGQNLRPDIAQLGRSNIFTRMMSGIYAADTNTNVFPSMHVIGSIAGVSALFDTELLKNKKGIFYKIGSIILAFFICISTVFVKQHSALDIFGGIAFSAVIYPIVFIIINKKMKKKYVKELV